MKRIKLSINQILITLILLAIFVYIILRAINLSFTHDESLSFQIIMGDKDFAGTANNHLLNSLLMKISSTVFGTSELALRLPNLLAFILYGSFCFRILDKYKNTILIFTGLAVLLLNPFLIEFFSLARGYGLALGFAMGSLYYLIKLEEDQTSRSFLFTMSFALGLSLLAALSNYSFLNLNIALLFIFSADLYSLIKNKTIHLDRNKTIILVIIYLIDIIILLSFINHLVVLRNRDQLYFGGESNFIEATLTTLIFGSIYMSYYGEIFWIRLLQIILIVFSFTIVYQMIRVRYDTFAKIALLLFLMVMATVMQHHLFDILYPVNRAGLVFIPIFGLLLLFLISHFRDLMKGRSGFILNIGVLILIALPMSYHFCKNLNLTHTKEWRYDADTKATMQVIRDYIDSRSADNEPVKITTWSFAVPTMNYYRDLYSLDQMQAVQREEIIPGADFIYCFTEDADSLKGGLDYQVIKTNELSNTILLRRTTRN